MPVSFFYFNKLSRRATKDTWGLVVESPARVVGIGFSIVLFSVIYNYKLLGRVEMNSFIREFGVASLATITVFLVVFFVHFLIISPKHLWLDSQKELSKNNEIIAQWEELYRPKFNLECGPQVVGSVAVVSGGYDFDSTFRIIIKSLGLNSLANCQGRIMEISREGKRIWSGEEMQLTFVLSGDKYDTHKLLDSNLPSYLEVIGVKDNRLKVATNIAGRGLGSKVDEEIQRPGKYGITIAIAAFNSVSEEGTLLLDWTGSFESSSLTLMSRRSLFTKPASKSL